MEAIKINNLGIIPNIGDLSKIKNKYLPIISEVKVFYLKELGDNLVSLYIRGSVSAGRDTNFSDLDFVAVTKRKINTNMEKRLSDYADYLQNKYKKINGFEIATVSFSQLLKSKDYFNLRMNLKTCSVILNGKDIRNLIPKVIPNKQLSLKMFNYASNEYIELKKYFSSSKEKSYLGKNRQVEFWCGWIMRGLSRSGMGILMLNEKAYTNDIKYISKNMAKKYPQFETFFIQAAKWVVEPTSDKKEVKSFLNKHVDVYFKFWKKLLN